MNWIRRLFGAKSGRKRVARGIGGGAYGSDATSAAPYFYDTDIPTGHHHSGHSSDFSSPSLDSGGGSFDAGGGGVSDGGCSGGDCCG